jgi:hypothetical protein
MAKAQRTLSSETGDEWEGPRSHLYVGNIIQGNRDLDAYFAGYKDEPET